MPALHAPAARPAAANQAASTWARDQAVELLNGAKLSTRAAAKSTHLKQLAELVIRKDPSLLGEFLEPLLELGGSGGGRAQDAGEPVRRDRDGESAAPRGVHRDAPGVAQGCRPRGGETGRESLRPGVPRGAHPEAATRGWSPGAGSHRHVDRR